jgi:hypothetical protein
MAECLLAALGTKEEDDDNEQHAHAYVGALLLAEGLIELRTIRKALTTTKGS